VRFTVRMPVDACGGPDWDRADELFRLKPEDSQFCRLNFEVVEARPTADGIGDVVFTCRRYERATGMCGAYEARPPICRAYLCAHALDGRVPRPECFAGVLEAVKER